MPFGFDFENERSKIINLTIININHAPMVQSGKTRASQARNAGSNPA